MDKTLLDKDGIPTIDELKEFFKSNDYSTAVSSFDHKKADNETNKIYIKAKKVFSDFWCENMGAFGGKGSFKNFSADYPLKCLEKADENYVAGSVMDVMASEQATANAYDIFFSVVEEPLMAELEKLAENRKITVNELTDDEILSCVDRISDQFLDKMMSLMMQSQSVPEVLNLSKSVPSQEDFNYSVADNYSVKDFEKKWNHTRAKISQMLSLDEFDKDDKMFLTDYDFEDIILQSQITELQNKFLDSLKDSDRQIILLRQKKYTQKGIAMELGYKNHSGVIKRLKTIRKNLDEFINLNMK